MQRFTLSLFFCLFAVRSLFGAEIVGPTDPVPAGEPAWVWIEGLQPNEGAMFWPEDYLQVGPPHLTKNHGLFWTKTEGTYKIRAVTVRIETTSAGAVPVLTPLSFTIKVGKGVNPNPPPPVPSETLWGLLIHDTEATGYEEAKIVNSVRLREMDPDRFTLDVYGVGAKDETKTEPPDDIKPWLELVASNRWKLPHLLLVNENGDLVSHAAPEDVDGAISFVKEFLKR